MMERDTSLEDKGIVHGELRYAYCWLALFMPVNLCVFGALNPDIVAHIGWYLMHLSELPELHFPGALLVLLAGIGVWVVVAGAVSARRGADTAGRTARRRALLRVSGLWLLLLFLISLLELAKSNGHVFPHLGWYIAHFQMPEDIVGVSGGRALFFALYAWLLTAVLFVRISFKRALFALLLIVLLGVLFNGGGAFNKWDTHRDMLRHISRFGILACGMTIVIISGGIDLAVGSVLGLVAVVSAILCIHLGMTPWLAIPICLGIGIACGSLSGILVARYQIQPFIATLAMMVFARGLAKLVSGGEKISRGVKTEHGFQYVDLPRVFEFLNMRILQENVAVVTLLFVLCIAISWLLLSRLRFGRYWYAIGGNEVSAQLSGVPVARMKGMAYALSGLFAAVAGVCQAAQETQGDPEAGATYELTAIAIVVIGGTSLTGGRGSILLTLLGALTIGYLEKILSINAVSEAGRLMLTGLIIVTAVLLQRRKN